MSTANRVVVTGFGVVAPNGIGTNAYWRSLLARESGIRNISRFDASDLPVRIAGEITEFRLSDFVPEAKEKRLARHTQLALVATRFALESCGLDEDVLARHRPLPIVMGVSTGGVDMIERAKEMLIRRGPHRVSPYIVGACQPHAVASDLAAFIGAPATTLTVATACAAGLDAVAYSAALIRSGRADLVITGGADSPLNPVTVAAFGCSGLVPITNGEDPRTISRPFDRERKGGVMAEGAGILVLERLESALARGAEPLLEIVGYGTASDVAGGPPGSALGDAMANALANAGVEPGGIDYVCAHGPSDPQLDRSETTMIKRILGRRAYRTPVSSIKGVTGNPLSASGPLALITCALAIRERIIPPTANYKYPDPECDLDYVGEGPRSMAVDFALVNVHGLGGGNSSMVVRRPVLQ